MVTIELFLYVAQIFVCVGFTGYRISVEQRVARITADIGRIAGRQVAQAVA